MGFIIACTSFDNETYFENMEYRKRNNEIVIYSPIRQIRQKYKEGTIFFVAEIINPLNKIEGIGVIRNSVVYDVSRKIYTNPNNNLYTYRGKYWFSRDEINNFDPEIITILENVTCKGKSNIKRGYGIKTITRNIFSHWKDHGYDYDELYSKLKQMFIYYYKCKEPEQEHQEQQNNIEENLIKN